jgi:putative membrane-bound dehydrogenase-like protein
MRYCSALVVLIALLSSCKRRGSEASALSAVDSLKAIHMSGDFHVELFAEEPQVMSPVEMVFDENGKIYVAEMKDYPDDPLPGKPILSRIRLLEDTNGDGKIDKATVFADHVLAVSGIMPWKGGLIVTSAPDILYLKDTNGDGKADVRKVLYTGFAKLNHETRITNPRLGPDNWVYCSNTGNDGRITSPEHPELPPVLVRGTDFRFDPVSGKMEAASGPAQFGSTISDFGDRFITQNTTHIRHVVVPMEYLARAPLLEVGAVAQDISDHGRPSARMFPLTGPQEWRKERTNLRQQRYNDNKSNRIEEVGGWFTAASGGTIYDGDAFPSDFVGNVFTGDVSGNLVHRDIIRPDGATYLAHRSPENEEFLASTDPWFRPCNFANAPDGNLYVTDIYRQVIETPESIPEEIRKKIDFYNGDTMGRIYRIVPNHPRRRGNLKIQMGSLSSAELVKQLANPNGWNRWTAQRLLLERQDHAVVEDLKKMTTAGPTPEGRVHALWLLKSYDALDATVAEMALRDSDPRVRRNAIQASEGLIDQSKPIAEEILKCADDSDSHVRFQASLTLGDVKDARTLPTLARLAHERSADSWFRIAILSSTANSASPFYDSLLSKGENWVDPQMLIELSALIGARQNTKELSRWFADVPKLKHSERELEGLSRGLKLSDAHGLVVPGGEHVITQMTKSKDKNVQDTAWNAALFFDFPSLIQQALKDAVNPAVPKGRRILAIGALRGGHFNTVAPTLDHIIQSLPLPDVEAASVDALASFSDPAVGTILLNRWSTLTHDGQQHALEALVAQQNRVPLLLKAIENGQVKPSALDPSVRSRLFENPKAAVVDESRKLLASTNTDRVKLTADYKDVLTMLGDPQKGNTLFAGNCGRCHLSRLGGGRVGPDLSGINNKTKDELLTDILNPSYAIEPRYISHIITTKDGYIYDGVISNETPGSINLQGGSIERDHTILRKNIATVQPSNISLMPEGFERTLSKQDIADIIAYLRGGL